MRGRVHSIETLGTVDGPGVRGVVFLQGCALRCRYCHNPDTWARSGGEEIEAAALVARLARFRSYYVRSGGGVTFSGGEPLLQPAFLAEALRLCRQAGLHTCLDTAGVMDEPQEEMLPEILRHTDLVLYDVKHPEAQGYRALTGQPIAPTERFVAAVRRAGVPMWVRHVVVPGVTDGEDHLAQLRDYVAALPGVQRVELLPYHLLGAHKYASLGLPAPLEGVPAMDAARCKALEKQYFSEWTA